MRTAKAVRDRVVATAFAIALAAGLAGCSGTPLDNVIGGVVDETVDRAANEALGGGVDVSTDGRMPEGFPEGAVPLVEGTLVGGGTGGGIGWVVVVNPDSVAKFADAQAALEGAGYTVNASNADTDSAFGSFTGPEYNVQLTFSTDSNGVVSATYIVTPV